MAEYCVSSPLRCHCHVINKRQFSCRCLAAALEQMAKRLNVWQAFLIKFFSNYDIGRILYILVQDFDENK